jgi:glycosyltransferase involved in cell wall biosynthesis
VKYILITSARNEQAFITETIQSVTAQTQPPERWVVIDDGSSDQTAEIVAASARKFPSRSSAIPGAKAATSPPRPTP